MVKMINLLHTDLNCIKSLNSDPSEFITNIKHTVLTADDVKFHNNCSICSISNLSSHTEFVRVCGFVATPIPTETHFHQRR